MIAPVVQIVCALLLFWVSRKQERTIRELSTAADILKQQRDALAGWLNVNGWDVTYETERLVIERVEDEEEERLRR